MGSEIRGNDVFEEALNRVLGLGYELETIAIEEFVGDTDRKFDGLAIRLTLLSGDDTHPPTPAVAMIFKFIMPESEIPDGMSDEISITLVVSLEAATDESFDILGTAREAFKERAEVVKNG